MTFDFLDPKEISLIVKMILTSGSALFFTNSSKACSACFAVGIGLESALSNVRTMPISSFMVAEMNLSALDKVSRKFSTVTNSFLLTGAKIGSSPS